jgi:hypothetical protein
MLHTLRFSLQNAVYFIMVSFLVPVLLTFYIQGVLKFKCKTSVPRGQFTSSHVRFNALWLGALCYTNPYLFHISYGNIIFDLRLFDMDMSNGRGYSP